MQKNLRLPWPWLSKHTGHMVSIVEGPIAEMKLTAHSKGTST